MHQKRLAMLQVQVSDLCALGHHLKSSAFMQLEHYTQSHVLEREENISTAAYGKYLLYDISKRES